MNWNANAILDDVSRATSNLILEEPFYGHFFVGIIKEVHERIQTMAIGPSGHHVKLHINPIFWKTQLTNDKLRMGLVKHEILHVVFKHIFRGKDYAQKDLFNIACDLVVNQYIRVEWLPANRIHLGLFPGIGLEPERDADEYYRKLSQLKEKFEAQAQENGEEACDADGDPQQKEGGEAWENLKNIIGQEDDWLERHGMWEDLERLPAAMREILEDQINEAIAQSLEKSRRDSREWGKLPAGLRQHLDEFEHSRKPSINWRRVLRIFSESSSRTFVRNTIKRASKRFGTTPGIKIKRRQKLLVALDTSGSISEEDLQSFFGEIYHIWKRGAEIMVVECDTKIAATYPYRGQSPAAIHGGGGTHFEAPIIYANTEYQPDALIYFTDGFGPMPNIPARMPILWMLSRSGCEAGPEHIQQFPGMKVRMHTV
jgi:predicted metal-dependent peptidase